MIFSEASARHEEAEARLFAGCDEIVALGAAVAAGSRDADLARRLASDVMVYGKGRLSQELAQEVVRRAVGIEGKHRRPASLASDDPMASHLVKACLSIDVDADERLMLLDQSGLLAQAAPERSAAADKRVAVIGAGASGVAMGRELLLAGYDVTLYERAGQCSGTWSQNIYPGCGVDSPSYVYCYSYAQKLDWTRYFVRQEEIHAYIEECAEAFGLLPSIRFETIVERCEYDASRCVWAVTSFDASGACRREEFDFVVSAVGQLNRPSVPPIAGMKDFRGTIVHTAEWDSTLDLCGKRVAVVGVGASAMQVVPTIAPYVAHLSVFQRQPHWIMPNRHYLSEISAEETARNEAFPAYLAWKRLIFNWTYGDAAFPALIRDPEWPANSHDAINAQSARMRDVMLDHLRRELATRPELIEEMTPSYPPYSKRVLLDNNWFKTFLDPDVTLVTAGIERFCPEGIRTGDGRLHEFDVVIMATGFQASQMLSSIEVVNAEGRALRDVWGDENPRAHLGVSVPDFPNFFIMYGPNTNLAFGGSAIIHSEIQSRYIVRCLELLRNTGSDQLDCRKDAFDRYNREVDERLGEMVWSTGRATSWFKNSAGRITTNSPWSMAEYWRRMCVPDPGAFRLGVRRADREPVRHVGDPNGSSKRG